MFKPKSSLVTDNFPVIENIKDQQVFNCSEYTGKYSSITGIISKFMYIGKIDQLTGDPEFPPTVRIVCGPECIDKCINIKV